MGLVDLFVFNNASPSAWQSTVPGVKSHFGLAKGALLRKSKASSLRTKPVLVLKSPYSLRQKQPTGPTATEGKHGTLAMRGAG